MKEEGDRGDTSSGTDQGVPFQKNEELVSSPSIPRIVEADLAILSAIREGHLTLLQVSDRIDMPFVECLRRAKNLEMLGLLSQVPNILSPEGLHYYSRRVPDRVEKKEER